MLNSVWAWCDDLQLARSAESLKKNFTSKRPKNDDISRQFAVFTSKGFQLSSIKLESILARVNLQHAALVL